ncbi:hypothetical protein V6B08_04300 [Ferrovibrio sp. MS7]|uniref:hypothetical protein n=1 Tax=Ferrovibrio plantarum TaxID=3119164 RepID=UPI003135D5F1
MSTEVIRLVLDSNAYDAVLQHDDAEQILAALDDGRIEILASPVVLAELRKVPDMYRQADLMALYYELQSRRLSPPDASMKSADHLLLAQAEAEGARLVSDDKALDALRYAEFRALL